MSTKITIGYWDISEAEYFHIYWEAFIEDYYLTNGEATINLPQDLAIAWAEELNKRDSLQREQNGKS